MKTNINFNGITLMTRLFSTICSSFRHKKVHPSPDSDDVIVEFGEGNIRGPAVRLSRLESGITIEFHHHISSARCEAHANEAFFVLGMSLMMTGILDPYKGTLYKISFWKNQKLDLLNLRTRRTNVLRFLIEFLHQIDQVSCEYLWEDELADGWRHMTPERKQAMDNSVTTMAKEAS